MVYVYERDEYAEAHRPGPRLGFWLAWVAATIFATVIARVLVTTIIDPTSNIGSSPVVYAAIGGAAVGALAGLCQGLLLLPYIKRSGTIGWVGATIIGRSVRAVSLSTVGLTLLDASLELGSNTNLLEAEQAWVSFCGYWLVSIVVGAVAGIPTGFAQSLVLKNQVMWSSRWILATMLASALVYSPVMDFFEGGTYRALSNAFPWIEQDVYRSMIVGIVTGLIEGVVTGMVLIDLLKHPTGQADWLTTNQRVWRPNRSIDISPQPAPEIFTEQVRAQEANRQKVIETQSPPTNIGKV
jgi:hypothetical protein